uniref:J domain-containing protein n=2 Tax=Rhizochromulina marina TaxID=1034831 RepID=A0A7S2RSL7_9STRA|mmetsp:Transcript_20480/g.59816  ORF Transcript_20480/g.59816 Transcript_20480/m.59816 type:complete len:919 (+) Transcript_20480:54-2810(+)
MRDLRFSHAHREKRVAMALAGTDVEQPGPSSAEALLSLGATEDDDTAFLYRVVALEGVLLWTAPGGEGQEIGRRDVGNVVRVASHQDGWLKLANSEKAVVPKLEVGRKVMVVDGQYKGERGQIVREMDDMREFGVRLIGYSGTGSFHISELKEDTFEDIFRSPQSPGGEGAYSGDLWMQAGSDVAELAEEDLPALTLPAEGEEAGLFDRPFEPRLEGPEGGATAPEADHDQDDGEGAAGSREDEHLAEALRPLRVSGPPGGGEATTLTSEGAACLFPVGSKVRLGGLKSDQYNGLCGTVITRMNANGRFGVRLDEQEEGKKILLRPENLTITKGAAAGATGSREAATEQEGAEANAAMEAVWQRAAATLGLSLEVLGLQGSSGSTAALSRQGAEDLISAQLRAVERNCSVDVTDARSVVELQRGTEVEARSAHAVLTAALETLPPTEASAPAPFKILPPHELLEKGWLGQQAAEAAQALEAIKSTAEVDESLGHIAVLLREEQRRLLRHDSEHKARDPAPQAYDQSLQAVEAALSDTCGDALIFRLARVRGLLRSRRDQDALREAAAAAKLHPTATAAQLCHARCLIRGGHQTEGYALLVRASSGGGCAGEGPSGRWAAAEAGRRLKAWRRAQRHEVRAKDAYSRGRFEAAATEYSSMLENLALVGDDRWARATAHVDRAACHRRHRDFQRAVQDCDAALALFPRYGRALFRRAMCELESGASEAAVKTLEQLLRVDRQWPNLCDWLIRATAQVKRQQSQGASGFSFQADRDTQDSSSLTGNEDYYAALGVPSDATDAQLKRAYRLQSLKYHPDRQGGSTTAFQLINTAYQTLSDPDKRQAYDHGVDVKKKSGDGYDSDEDDANQKSLREEVERKYFPERFKFWPFGDPFIEKRRREARRNKEKKQQQQQRRQAWSDY